MSNDDSNENYPPGVRHPSCYEDRPGISPESLNALETAQQRVAASLTQVHIAGQLQCLHGQKGDQERGLWGRSSDAEANWIDGMIRRLEATYADLEQVHS